MVGWLTYNSLGGNSILVCTLMCLPLGVFKYIHFFSYLCNFGSGCVGIVYLESLF